ncbi:MAG: GlsB/YeaQ/YmgE family stress response membrane protein [Pseudonocardiaceae bacterium]
MDITGIFTAILVGAIIGALGRLAVPGRQTMALWLTIALGIVAALVGTAIAGVIGVADTSGIDWIELFLQVGLAAAGVSIATRTPSRQLR